MNEAGGVVQELMIEHSAEGLLKLDAARQAMGVAPSETEIGVETGYNLLIDFLLGHNYPAIYVLPPHQVKSNQGRYAQSGAKDDRRDAWVIADMLRTDRGRWHAWQEDSLLTRQIQAQVHQVIYLNQMIRRQSNHLRAVLLRYYPAALEIFSRMDSPICLRFLQDYPSPEKASQLSQQAFTDFLREHHHTQKAKWADCYSRLIAARPNASSDTVTIYASQAQRLGQWLLPLVLDKPKAIQELNALFERHPDAHIYQSLPGVGDFLAPALLAKLGDDRQRFPTAAVLQAVAGTCPITRRSGSHKTILFRKACDHEFRYIMHQWAQKVILAAPWAKTYFVQLRKRNIPQNDAVRRVANRLIVILWTLWYNRSDYDETRHLQQLTLRAKPRA
jgi:transposase